MSYPFDDFVRTTMAAATDMARSDSLDQAQQQTVADYLRSPGSGLTPASSFEDFVRHNMETAPPKLPATLDYITYASKDNASRSNFLNSKDYIAAQGNAGLIGDTPWGKFIEDPANDPSFKIMADKFKAFMTHESFKPLNNDYVGALRDVMWNAGSQPYMSNALASGRPIRGFVENATPNRGFTNFELPTALGSPDTVFNGYPMRTFMGDPVGFASRTATELQQLETHLAQSASINSHRVVSVADIRANVDVIGGYNAVGKTLFGQSVTDFSTHDLTRMSAISQDWRAQIRDTALRGLDSAPVTRPSAIEADRATPESTKVHFATGSPELKKLASQTLERSLPTGKSAFDTRATPAVAEVVAPHSGVQSLGRVLGTAATVAAAYDAYTTAEQYQALSAQGNQFGADALLRRYEGRTAGGFIGGFGAGVAYGFAAGSEAGPGAFITGAVGGVVGAFAGDKIATMVIEHKVNHQTGTDGVVYAYEHGSWQHTHYQLDSGGASVPNPYGAASMHAVVTPAPAGQIAQLDYQRMTAITALSLANPGTQDTKNIDLDGIRWHTTHEGWARQVGVPGVPNTYGIPSSIAVDRPADARTSEVLDQLAANRRFNNEHYAEDVANAYVMDYYGNGWNANGLLPDLVTKPLGLPSEQHIKDPVTGQVWNASKDGQFSREGHHSIGKVFVRETVPASGEVLSRLSKRQQAAIASNTVYGNGLIAQAFETSENSRHSARTARAQEHLPDAARPGLHAGVPPSVSADDAIASKTAAPITPQSSNRDMFDAMMNAATHLDLDAMRSVSQSYLQSPQGQAWLEQGHQLNQQQAQAQQAAWDARQQQAQAPHLQR